MPIKKILCFILAVGSGLGGGSLVRAQEERLTLIPPFSEIFPAENLPDGVHLKYPILVNDHTVLRPDVILRFIYLDANTAAHAHVEDTNSDTHVHIGAPGAPVAGDKDAAHDRSGAAGWGGSDASDTTGIFDEKREDMKRRKQELQTEVWRVKDLFNDALDHATELGTTLVYSLPAQEHPLTASFDLPEGMLLAEIKGHVEVLGLKEESRSYVGGIRPGDEIRSFKGSPAVRTLVDFMREYSETKHHAKATGDPSYGMEIWRPGTGQPMSIQIAAPPSIPSFFKDSFSSPLEQKP